MSGTFDIAADASINMTAGSAGAVGTGAYTLVALFRPTTGNNNSGIMWCDASGSHQRSFFEDALNLFGFNDFSSGFGSLTQGNWYLVAQSKPAGSNLYRFHIWPYASDGSGTMSHGTESGGANQGDGSTIDAIRIGIAEDRGNSLIAAVGLWTRVLSDAELDSMKSGSLSAWTNVSGGAPAELISLENWNGSTGATAVVGTSTLSGITGSVAAGANPPGFSFALTAPLALSGPPTIPPYLFLQLAARNAAMWQSALMAGTSLSDSSEPGTAFAGGTVVSSVINQSSNVEAGFAEGVATRVSSASAVSSSVEAGHAFGAATKATSALSLQSAVEAGSALGRNTRVVSSTALASAVEAGHALGVTTRVSQSLAFSISDAVEAASAFAGSTRTTSVINRRTDVEAALAQAFNTRAMSVRNLSQSVEAGAASAWGTSVKTLRVLVHNVDGSFTLVGSVSIQSTIQAPNAGFVIPGGVLALAVPVSSLLDFGPADGVVDVLIVGRTDVGDFVGVVDVTTQRGSVSL